MTDQQLDELRLLGDELRAVFTAERNAIAALDHERLVVLAETKQHVAVRLAALQPMVSKDADARTLFEAIRIEARATALLAAAAMKVVQAMLGQTEPTGCYDRRANRTAVSAPAFRNLRAF
ncbi:MAG: hypothetical protein ABI591_13600 [Kofleriaceae bacterium]